MAKLLIRNARGNKQKQIDEQHLEQYLKLGWGKVNIGKPKTIEVVDFAEKGKRIKVKQKVTPITVEYAVDSDLRAKDKEIEALKKQLAEQNK